MGMGAREVCLVGKCEKAGIMVGTVPTENAENQIQSTIISCFLPHTESSLCNRVFKSLWKWE